VPLGAARAGTKLTFYDIKTCLRKTNEMALKSGFRVKTPIMRFIEKNISEGTSYGFCNMLNIQLDLKGS